MIDKILEVCVNSARAESVTLVEGKGKTFETRAQVHAQVILPPAAGKSTGIVSSDNVVPSFDPTLPGIAGSITKDGELVRGSAFNAAGKVMFIDERQNMSAKAKEALLSLLEQQYYKRDLGFVLKRKFSTKRKYAWVKAKDGDNCFWIGSRFSCLCSGLRKTNLASKFVNENDIAWEQRFMTVNLTLEPEDFYRVVRGKPLFRVKRERDYGVPPVFEEYIKFSKRHEKHVKKLRFYPFFKGFFGGFLTRNSLDLARMMCYFGRKKGSVLDSFGWENMATFSLYNVASSTLTFNEYRTLEVLTHSGSSAGTQRKLARKLGVSQPAVSKIISRLRRCGLYGK